MIVPISFRLFSSLVSGQYSGQRTVPSWLTALRTLLFLGFYNAGFYGGNFSNKLELLRRTLKSRGLKYIRDPRRIYRTARAYFSWRKIVNDNLHSLDKKVKNQIKYGNLNEMNELKNAIINE